jgi:hypothetical protein
VALQTKSAVRLALRCRLFRRSQDLTKSERLRVDLE